MPFRGELKKMLVDWGDDEIIDWVEKKMKDSYFNGTLIGFDMPRNNKLSLTQKIDYVETNWKIEKGKGE